MRSAVAPVCLYVQPYHEGVHEAYRCGKTGLYYIYEPAGGALTVARK